MVPDARTFLTQLRASSKESTAGPSAGISPDEGGDNDASPAVDDDDNESDAQPNSD